MIYIDSTQKKLYSMIKTTEDVMNHLLEKTSFSGNAKIVCNLDLGFPHDVIRIAGGFATGIYVSWNSKIPFIPIDICMNACTVSIYKLDQIKGEIITKNNIEDLLSKLNDSSYIANFHRGNHFISYVESVIDASRYMIIHSSTAEFETLYNGLYPVENNFFYEKIRTFYYNNQYVRYLDGQAAELFQRLAENLYVFNENRHDFIISLLVGKNAKIHDSKHYHHYGMPSSNEAIIGCHLIKDGQQTPLLTRPGENIYIIQYNKAIDEEFSMLDKFTTPHGFGKCHLDVPNIDIDIIRNTFILDSREYKIQYGASLRDHPNLHLRNLPIEVFMNYLSKHYDCKIVQEFKQLVSYNKMGFIDWRKHEK